MKFIFPILLASLALNAEVQSQSITGQLQTGGSLPEKILNGRSVVLYSPLFTTKEINDLHAGLMRSGIDAVAYFEADRVFAGPDVEDAFSKYFSTREIECLVICDKLENNYAITITPFNAKAGFVEPGQRAWSTSDAYLKEALRQLYSQALNTYKKENLLISEVPELNLSVNVITARRTEAFATDLKVDGLAVQKFGDERDAELEEIMKAYPFKYKLVDAGIPEPELRKQGLFYILRFVHSRGPVAKALLGYEVREGETALVSVTYENGVERVKTIPAEIPVYKFYFRQIEFNNVFLGTRWDADVSWQKGLQNFITGFKRELRIE
jgi:hypothetical protein